MKISHKKLRELLMPNNISRICLSRKKGKIRLIISTRSGLQYKTNFVGERDLFESVIREEFIDLKEQII